MMKLRVLVDNNTLIDRYFTGEPGLSIFIEIDGTRVLFDTGYSNIFLANADRMGIDLLDVDTIVLSHAHLDHTWGLQHLIQRHAEAAFEQATARRPGLVAHPTVFDPRTVSGLGEIGSLVTREKAGTWFDLGLSREPVWLHPDLVFLGQIERTNDFEALSPIGQIHTAGGIEDDYLLDDSALAFRSAGGLVIVTGCSHAGICNIVTQAMAVCNETRIADIIGGFHLLDPPARQLEETVRHFGQWAPAAMHPCHCTDLGSMLALARVAPVQAVGVGLERVYPGADPVPG
jgi:7,8-dihydropterin-6-yl-methyl-4-(beta-D-ribofuranosyl)aminobenzene 5'-phosphate synthase